MRKALAWTFAALAAIALILTLVSLIPSDRWFVQALNFPRLLSLIVIAIAAFGCIVFMRRRRAAVLAILAVAAGLQLWRLYPYVPFAPVEMADLSDTRATPVGSCFKALGFNVLQHNRDYAATLRMIDRERPDILLLMETDAAWVDALRPVLARYPHTLLRPIDNTYGIVFASRLPVSSSRIENITDRNTPTLYARMATRDGTRFDFVGLHPRPPRPGQSTALRDRKIAHAARRVAGNGLPSLAMGDFNAVPWSTTSRLFKQVGGYLDPRVGRGSYPTFPADFASVGWPLDQIFVSPAFAYRSLRILDDVGSDHRPLMAELCLSS